MNSLLSMTRIIRQKFMFVICVLLFVVLSGCAKEPIKIGFIGEISSGNSQVAIDARNGIEYYFNEVNENGGINGRQIEFIVKDNQGEHDTALLMHEEFLEEDVHFVIGDLLSQMVDSIIESNSDELMFITPTISTDAISGYDDFIIRTIPISTRQADIFCEYAEVTGIDDLVVVYDVMNAAYTESIAKRVELLYAESELTIKGMVPYDSRVDDLMEVVNKIEEYNPKNVFMISVAIDTAIMVQMAKKNNPELGIYSVAWAMTNDLIQNGGKYVDEAVFVGIYFPEVYSNEYNEFSEGFNNYYGSKPSFISVLAYDAATVLVKGLENAEETTPMAVKQSIIEIKQYKGLQETFNIDKFGDNNKQYMMYILENNEFVPLREWK